MNPLTMLSTQFVLFVCLGIGFFLGKKGIISDNGRKEITDLVLDVMLPASIIAAFMQVKFSKELMHQSVQMLIVAAGLQIASIFLGKLLFPRSRVSEEDRKIFRYSMINTNASFVALPILNSLMGSIGTVLTSIALIPIRISLWTVGIAIFIDEKDTAKRIKTVALNTNMVACYIGIILMLLPVEYPNFLIKAISTVGSGTTFISMMIVGYVISKLKLKHFLHFSVLYYCLLRLIVIPLALLAVLKVLHADEAVTATAVIIAGVPAGSFTAMMAAKYHGNEVLAGQVVFTSTLFSLVTLPLLCLLF